MGSRERAVCRLRSPAAELGLTLVGGRRADAVMTADLCRRNAGFLPPQDPYALLFGEPRSFRPNVLSQSGCQVFLEFQSVTSAASDSLASRLIP